MSSAVTKLSPSIQVILTSLASIRNEPEKWVFNGQINNQRPNSQVYNEIVTDKLTIQFMQSKTKDLKYDESINSTLNYHKIKHAKYSYWSPWNLDYSYGFDELTYSCELKKIPPHNPKQEFAKLFVCELIVRKHTVLTHTHMTGISSTLKIIVNGEFNSCRILKTSNTNSKIRVVSKNFMKHNKKLVDVQCVQSIIQNNFFNLSSNIQVSNVLYTLT